MSIDAFPARAGPFEADRFDARRAIGAFGLLRDFNEAGVLSVADVHVARRLVALAGEADEWVTLAAALAVRGPRLGHVCVDLSTIRETATVDAEDTVDLSTLPWPEPVEWMARLEASAEVVGVGEAADETQPRPLRLVGSTVYLDRYWREERQIAADLLALADAPPANVDLEVLGAGLERLFPRETASRQSLAAGSAVLRRFAVVAGGPGTGKTTTVARIVALLAEQASATGSSPPLVALAAPTGKAAARLQEAVHEEAPELTVAEPIREQLLGLTASTLHRLLGWRPGSHSRFRHHRGNRLPHDVVIVDETSMVSLSLMARLVEAVRPEARLVLVGDPGQLTSIEAGAVLGDVVGPAVDGLIVRPEAGDALTRVTGHDVQASAPPSGGPIGEGIVVLDRVHRFGTGIAAVADAVRRGDADALMSALGDAPDEVTWIPVDVADPAALDSLAPVREGAVASARAVIDAARAGNASEAIDALGAFRVLCAHRQGPHGVAAWTARIESWLADEVEGFGAEGRWYVGRPLLVTQNDYGLRLYNGDTGVVIATGTGGASAAFERSGQIVQLSPSRLGAVDTVYAMTVHKSQGSQVTTAALLLPPPSSRILTRELLYTAVTRARERLIVTGAEATIRSAVSQPVARASGLRWRLWHQDAPPSAD